MLLELRKFICVVTQLNLPIKTLLKQHWEHREDIIELIQELRENATEVYAIEQTSDSIVLDNFQPKKETKTAVVFGNEVQGVQQKAIDVCNGVIEIPQIGTKHSLNISVSNGVVLWDLYSKLRK